MSDTSTAIVTAYFDCVRDRDLGVVDLFHDDARLVGLGTIKFGKSEVRDFYTGVIENAGPTPRLVGGLLADAGRVAAEIEITLRDGATIHAVDLFEVEDGRIRCLTYFLRS